MLELLNPVFYDKPARKGLTNPRIFLIFCYTVLIFAGGHGQTLPDTLYRHKVAVFTPLYLDSAFDATGNYRYEKNFPKFINPGLEFYEGISMALDTLQTLKVKLDIRVYDTRSATRSISQVLTDTAFDSTELIIGHVNAAELHELALAASQR